MERQSAALLQGFCLFKSLLTSLLLDDDRYSCGGGDEGPAVEVEVELVGGRLC